MDMARDLGLSNTLMFYEQCFILVEGDTEENTLPLLYRTLYGHSLLEDGIRLVNVESNGAFREFFRLLSRNRQEVTLVFTDLDTKMSPEGRRLTTDILRHSHFDEEFLQSHIYYVPADETESRGIEFEAAFSDVAIAGCLQMRWPRKDGDWTPEHIRRIRGNKKFPDELKKLVWCEARDDSHYWTKPEFGSSLGQYCTEVMAPTEVLHLFKRARDIAGCERANLG